MNKLLSMELKRAITSPILWIGIIITAFMPAYKILLNSYGFSIFTSTFLLENTSIICIFMAIFISLHIGQDFEARTINNKISVGYKREQIYCTEVIVSAVCGLILLATDTICVFVFSAIKHLEFNDEITLTGFFFNLIISLVCVITISSLFTLIAMIAHQRILSIAIAVLLTLGTLHIGDNVVSDLTQPEYRLDVESNEMVENPLYITGIKRTVANTHLLFSPFAQAEYEPFMLLETLEDKQNNSIILKQFPYHIEFCIVNLLELILFYQIGIYVFRKQDLK